MIIDKIFFDSKNRFYQFYISLNFLSFMFAVTIADFDFEIHWGLMDRNDVSIGTRGWKDIDVTAKTSANANGVIVRT